MTTQRRTAVAVSGLTLLAFALSVGGCGFTLETNEAACKRVVTYVFGCGAPFFPLSTTQDVSEAISEACATVSESSECDWSEVEDCVRSFPCEQWLDGSSASELCLAILSDLISAGCGPSPGGPS